MSWVTRLGQLAGAAAMTLTGIRSEDTTGATTGIDEQELAMPSAVDACESNENRFSATYSDERKERSRFSIARRCMREVTTIAVLVAAGTSSQTALGCGDDHDHATAQGCRFSGVLQAESQFVVVHDPVGQIPAIMVEITKAVGLQPNFAIHPAQIGNASAVIVGETRVIYYDPTLLQQLMIRTGTKWSTYAVLAHEIAHHLNGDTFTRTGSRPDIELNADYWAGFIMRKLGASLGEARSAMSWLPEAESFTHPGRARRLFAVENGWNEANANANATALTAPPASAVPTTSSPPAATPTPAIKTLTWRGLPCQHLEQRVKVVPCQHTTVSWVQAPCAHRHWNGSWSWQEHTHDVFWQTIRQHAYDTEVALEPIHAFGTCNGYFQ